MIRVVAFALCLGLAVGAVRNEPPMVHAQHGAFLLVLIAAVVSAYYAGRWRRPAAQATAVAVASAKAEATSVSGVQVAIFNGAPSGREAAASTFGGLDRAEWRGVDQAVSLDGVDPDVLDAYDPVEILDAYRAGIQLESPDEQDAAL